MTLLQKGIHDKKVLDAFLQVPRHLFMDKSQWHLAYEDRAQAIGSGQTISQPYTVAFQSQLLQIEPGMKVLEIGTGSGYQAAILATMGARVYSVERHEPLAKTAVRLFEQLRYPVAVKIGDGTLGWAEHAPYDRIIVTAAAPHIPRQVVEQLAPGGILVIPYGERERQKMYSVTKDKDGKLHTQSHGDFVFVPLIGQDGFSA